MKKALLLFFVLFLSNYIFGQEHQAVATKMDNARFEVIQNPIVRKYTFYLDKVEGKVYQLVKTNTGSYSWEEMMVFPEDNKTYTEPTYQIYMGGIAAADSFLINTKTGRTWCLVQSRDEKILWEEFY